MGIPVIDMIIRSGWVARTILLLLAMFSLITWAVIFNRVFYLRRINFLNKRFRNVFEGLKNISQIEKVDKVYDDCPLGNLGKVSFTEYKRIVADAKTHSGVKDWSFYLQNQFYMASERIGAVTAVCPLNWIMECFFLL